MQSTQKVMLDLVCVLVPLDKKYYQCGLHKLHVVYSIWKPYFSSSQYLVKNTLPCSIRDRLFHAFLWLYYFYDLNNNLIQINHYDLWLNILKKIFRSHNKSFECSHCSWVLSYVILVTRCLALLKGRTLNYPHLCFFKHRLITTTDCISIIIFLSY